MTGPRTSHARAAYVTVNTRTEKIRDLWGREPTANEFRAIAELPLTSKIYLDDNSENGKKIYQLLWHSEQKRDTSLLEDAGRLLWEQSMRLPPHLQSPTPSTLPPLGLPENVYQFSPISNDPFAKVGSVKTIESRAVIRNIPVTKSLDPNLPVLTESHPEEPECTTYPELLINPPERWLRKPPHSSQPMRLIQPLACAKSNPVVQHQVQGQIAAPTRQGEQKPSLLKISNSVKASGPNVVRKPAVELKSETKAPTNKPVPLVVPTFSLCTGQQAYFVVPTAPINPGAYSSPYTAITNQHPNFPASVATLSENNHPLNPFLASQSQFPASSVSGITLPTTQPTLEQIQNQHPYNPAANQPPLTLTPAIPTPIMPIISNPQDQTDMLWLQLTPGNYRLSNAAAPALQMPPYDEVYRLAKETADNLNKMLAEQ